MRYITQQSSLLLPDLIWHLNATSRVFEMSNAACTFGSSITTPDSSSTDAGRAPEALMSSCLVRLRTVSDDAAVMHSRKKSGRDLTLDCSRVGSSVS